MIEERVKDFLSHNFNTGLGRAYRYLRSLKEFEAYGDIVLFKGLIVCFRKNNIQVTNRTIVRQFSLISPDQYVESEKAEILADLKAVPTSIRGYKSDLKSPYSGLLVKSDVGRVM